jgi:hypothetical protein
MTVNDIKSKKTANGNVNRVTTIALRDSLLAICDDEMREILVRLWNRWGVKKYTNARRVTRMLQFAKRLSVR